ncbi:MAG TPA: 5-dehydro-2-deoxygluconokinase [Gaiellaceae bacterium]|nr:5-dehydro-2-deoxygluconokinase [Gaiellaceae bacterium]
MTPEVLTVGRVSVDLYPEQVGVPLAEVRTFRKLLGGSPTNVAVAAARLGRRTAVVTKVGDDPFGAYVRKALSEFGVDARLVGTHPRLRTPLAFCEIFPPDRFPLLFYREPKAPDLELGDDDLGAVASEAALLWTTGTGLSAEPSRRTTLAALGRRARRPIVVYDLDYRATFWSSAEEAGRWNREALAFATVVVGNAEEVSVTLGRELEAEQAARALLELGPELAVVKRGADGVFAMSSSETIAVPPVEIEVVNGLGAGDAFGGALCHGLLAGWPLERTLRYANAAGALVASRLGCADDMPTAGEVEELLCAA